MNIKLTLTKSGNSFAFKGLFFVGNQQFLNTNHKKNLYV